MKALENILWWFKHRLVPRHRYHVMKTPLKPGFCDPSLRIAACLFAEAECYVERVQYVDWADDTHEEAWRGLMFAVAFWKSRREDILRDGDDGSEEFCAEMSRHLRAILYARPFMWYP